MTLLRVASLTLALCLLPLVATSANYSEAGGSHPGATFFKPLFLAQTGTAIIHGSATETSDLYRGSNGTFSLKHKVGIMTIKTQGTGALASMTNEEIQNMSRQLPRRAGEKATAHLQRTSHNRAVLYFHEAFYITPSEMISLRSSYEVISDTGTWDDYEKGRVIAVKRTTLGSSQYRAKWKNYVKKMFTQIVQSNFKHHAFKINASATVDVSTDEPILLSKTELLIPAQRIEYQVTVNASPDT